MFSPRSLDKGTGAMLEICNFSVGDNILDLGCGSGIVGITAAICGATVTMCDIDETALKYALNNIDANLDEAEKARVKCLVSDGFENIDEKDFTVILSNPPYHTDFSVAKRFIEGAFMHLKLSGRLYMVTKRFEWYKNKIINVFGGVKVTEADGYYVFMAEKRRDIPARVVKKKTKKEKQKDKQK